MSQDPYPGDRPRPDSDRPYSDDPYVSGGRPSQPAHDEPAYGQPHQPGYGQPTQPASHQPAYGQPPAASPYVYGATPPQAPVPPPYAYPPQSPPDTSAIVLTVISGFLTLTGLCCYVSIVPLVFGILGLAKQNTDPEGAKEMTKYGWISFAVVTALAVLAGVVVVALIVASEA